MLLLLAACGVAFNLNASVAPAEPRTLLVEVRDIPADEQTGEGSFVASDYNRERVVSLIRNHALLLATPAELDELAAAGFAPKVIMENKDQLVLYRRALYGPTLKLDPYYHSYAQIIARADELMRAHPRLMQRFQIGETTQFRQPIYAYRISNAATMAQDRPAVLLNGAHHSDELIGTETVVRMMEKLIAGYGSDPVVTRWMDQLEIWLVPVVNVDGHNVVTSGHDPRWRKNLRDVNGDGITGVYPEGVDVNRGYNFNWALGGSDQPDAYSYRGPHPFAEAENRAMRQLADLQQFLLSISYHSQGEVIFYPWTWGGRPTPDDAVITRIVRNVAAQIGKMDGSGTYDMSPGGPSSQSYPWFYGRRGTIDMIVETGKGSHIFSAEDAAGIVQENLKGAAALFDHAFGPGLNVRVTDATTGAPLVAEVWLPRIDNETVDRRHSNAEFGRAYRLLEPGTYYVVISRPGYETVVLPEQSVAAEGWTELEVAMKPVAGGE